MTRFFCCCLPVRLGVFVLSFLQLLIGGAEAGLLWHAIMQDQVEGTKRIAFIIVASVNTLLAASAFLGLCGATTRSRGLVATYATVLYVLLVATLASGIWFGYSLFHDTGDDFKASCRKEGANIKAAQIQSNDVLSGGYDKALDGICSGLLTTFKIVYIVLAVIVFFIELYCAHIVRNYAEQLGEEEASRRKVVERVIVSQPQPAQAVPVHYGGYNNGYHGSSAEKYA